MLILGFDIIIGVLMLMVMYSLFSKRSYSLGRWRYRDTNKYKYWEAIVAYNILVITLLFLRYKVVSSI